MNKATAFLCYGISLLLIGCAAPQKAEIAAGDDVQGALAEVTGIRQKAQQQQVDLLAHDQFQDAEKFLEKANNALSKGYKAEIVLENSAIAKAYLVEAEKTAMQRRSYSERILVARQSALDAGLRDSEELLDQLEDVDDDLRDESDQFSDPLTPAEFSSFQKRYLSLEIRAVQQRELNEVETRIERAVDQDAKDRAPQTLHTAQLDFEDARNIIELSPRNPQLYRKGVNKAVESSILLADVMEVILDAEGTPEDIALQIVYQNRKLSSLSQKAGQLEADLETTQSSLIEKSSELLEKEKMLMRKDLTLEEQGLQLRSASTEVRFQKAMDTAREQFPESEALVYQQGGKLIFRLKRVNFKTGTSTVPERSKSMLMKINEIISNLQAESVIVQGHTDSVGSDKLNLDLSTRRANSVAKYLNSLAGGYRLSYIGYGEARPIASNETAEGRAINRRVDLVVSARK